MKTEKREHGRTMTGDDGGLRWKERIADKSSTSIVAVIVNRKNRETGGERQNDRNSRIYK